MFNHITNHMLRLIEHIDSRMQICQGTRCKVRSPRATHPLRTFTCWRRWTWSKCGCRSQGNITYHCQWMSIDSLPTCVKWLPNWISFHIPFFYFYRNSDVNWPIWSEKFAKSHGRLRLWTTSSTQLGLEGHFF